MRSWSVYWIDGRGSGIDKPVIARFRGNTGRFYDDEKLNGRPIRVPLTYRDLGRERTSWGQAFSSDGGRSWETNWFMDFERKNKIA